MTVSEAAKQIGCSPRLVYRLCQEGLIAHRRIGFGRGRIDLTPAHVAEYLERAERPADLRTTGPAPKRMLGVMVPDELGEYRRERAERQAARAKAKRHQV